MLLTSRIKGGVLAAGLFLIFATLAALLAFGPGAVAGPIEDAVIKMRQPEVTVRINAALDLTDQAKKQGKEAIPSLFKALDAQGKQLTEDAWLTRISVSSALVEIGNPAIPDLITALKDPLWEKGYTAAIALGEIGKPALENVAQVAKSGDLQIRKRAIWVLGKIKDPQSAATLMSMLGDKELQADVAFALLQQGEGAIPQLTEKLSDPELTVAVWSAWVLSQLGKPAVPALKKVYETQTNQVASGLAAQAFVWMGPAGLPTLLGELKSQNTQLSGMAGNSLREMGEPAVKTLMEVASNPTEGKNARYLAIWAIGSIGDPKTVNAMKQVTRDPDRLMQRKADWALRRMGVPTAMEPRTITESPKNLVMKIARETGVARREAISDLLDFARSKGREAIPALEEALGAQGKENTEAAWVIRLSVASTFVDIGAPAVPALIQALKDPVWEKCYTAAIALREIGKPALGEVAQLVKTGDLATKKRAIWVLGRIKDPQSVAALLPLLNDKDLQADAAFALLNQGESIIPQLGEKLSGRELSTAVWSGWVLSQLGKPALPTLKKVYEGQANKVASGLAAQSLVWMGQEGIPTLLTALNGPNTQLAGLAANSLRDMGTPAVNALMGVARSTERGKNSRFLALWALGSIGDPRAAAVMTQVTRDPDKLMQRTSKWALKRLKQG